MKFLKIFIILIISLFLGCGGTSNTTSSNNKTYSLSNTKNVAALGPLENADVKIYKLSDLNKSIYETTTGKFGNFSVNLQDKNLSSNDLLLIKVSGGKDIDPNDDGFIDTKPIINKGIIHGYGTVSDLKSGKVHITLLSELVYQYTKQYIPEIGKEITMEDFKNIIEYVTQLFLNKTETNPYIKLIRFNPIKDKKLFNFNYSNLVDGNSSLVSLYHQGKDQKIIESKLKKLFLKLPISLNSSKLLQVRKYYKVSFVSSHVSYNTQGFKLNKNFNAFVKKDSNISINIRNIDAGYKILKWYGCDEVSDDLKICKINNINSDKLISVVVVPQIKVKSGIKTIDVSNAYVEIDTNSSLSDQNVSMTLYSDMNDNTTKNLLASINNGDIIIHKNNPVFFGKVISKSKINDFRYKVKMEKIPLSDVLESGYISVSDTKIGTYGSITSSRVLSKALVLPNGNKINFNPNQPAKIKLIFEKNRILFKTIDSSDGKTYPYVKQEKTDKGIKAEVYLNKYTTLTGTLTLTPIFNYDLAWSLWDGLESMNLKIGEQLETNASLNVEREFDFNKNVKITTLYFYQTIMVGPFPVVLTEPITIYLGVDGKISAKGELGISDSLTPTLNIAYSKKSGVKANLSLNPTALFYGEINGNEETFAYFGIFPKFEIYGIGGGLDNKLGFYNNIYGEAKEKVTNTVEGTKLHIASGLKGEYGIEYKGALQLSSSWSIVSDVIKEINEKLSEHSFDKKWKLGSFDFSYDSDKPKPGFVNVVGLKNISTDIAKENVSTLNKVYIYKLTNTGGTNIYYKVKVNNLIGFNAFLSNGASSILDTSEITGELKPGESKDIALNIDGSSIINKIGKYKTNLIVYQSNKPIFDMRPYLLMKKVFTSNIIINVLPDDLSSLPKTNLDINVSGSTIKKLVFNWNDYKKYGINGYKIYMGDYNASNDTCNNIRLFAQTNKNTYVADLLALENTSNYYKKIQPNKTYCFEVSGYKNYITINGKRESYERILTNDFTKITPIKLSKDKNASIELDIMFLVDTTGSYDDDIDTFRKESKNIINTLKEKLPKNVLLKVGVSSFEDYPNTKYDSSSTDKPYTLELGLTSNYENFINAIDELKLGYGGDEPEAQLTGLYQTVTDPKVGWNKSAMKMILLFTDASFHDHDRDPSYPGPGSSEVKKLLTLKGITVIGIGSGEVSEDLANISNYTYLLNSDSSGVVNAISSLIEAIPGSKINAKIISLKRIIPSYDFIGEPNN